MKKRIVKILMDRDGLSEKEAQDHVKRVHEYIHAEMANLNFDDLEELMADEFGLEPDFIEDFIM